MLRNAKFLSEPEMKNNIKKRPKFDRFFASNEYGSKHVINLQVLLVIVFPLRCLCVMEKGKIYVHRTIFTDYIF